MTPTPVTVGENVLSQIPSLDPEVNLAIQRKLAGGKDNKHSEISDAFAG